MVDLLAHYMAPIMFASLVLFLLLGYPVAFSLAANGLIFALIGIEITHQFQPDFLQALPERMYEGAFVPGIALAGLYAVYVFILTLVFPKSAPGLPPEDLIHKEPDGRRGVWQLGLLTVFSGVVGYYIMAQTQVKSGADFVILT